MSGLIWIYSACNFSFAVFGALKVVPELIRGGGWAPPEFIDRVGESGRTFFCG